MSLLNKILDLYNETITDEPSLEKIEKLLDSKDKDSIELGASLLSKTKITDESNKLWNKFYRVNTYAIDNSGASVSSSGSVIGFKSHVVFNQDSQEHQHSVLSDVFSRLKEKELEGG